MRHLFLLALILLALAGAGLAESTFCSPCAGSGKCHVCEGDGLRYDGSTCSWCSGSADCYYCTGRGNY